LLHSQFPLLLAVSWLADYTLFKEHSISASGLQGFASNSSSHVAKRCSLLLLRIPKHPQFHSRKTTVSSF